MTFTQLLKEALNPQDVKKIIDTVYANLQQLQQHETEIARENDVLTKENLSLKTQLQQVAGGQQQAMAQQQANKTGVGTTKQVAQPTKV